MHTAIRPWTTTGIALVGASVIAVAPITPLPTPPAPPVAVAAGPATVMADVELTASIADILQFPALRQYIINEVGDFLIRVNGLVQAGAGVGEVIGSIPETLVLLTQQLFSLDLVGALDTITDALVGGFLTVTLPIIESRALIQEREAAILGALATAAPEALLGAGAAIVGAIGVVLEAAIVGGQQVVDALLPLDLGNLITAFVDATGDFFASFGTAGQILVDGIVFAQQTIAEALAAQPSPTATAAETELAGPATSPDLDNENALMMTMSTVTADQGEQVRIEPITAELDPPATDIVEEGLVNKETLDGEESGKGAEEEGTDDEPATQEDEQEGLADPVEDIGTTDTELGANETEGGDDNPTATNTGDTDTTESDPRSDN